MALPRLLLALLALLASCASSEDPPRRAQLQARNGSLLHDHMLERERAAWGGVDLVVVVTWCALLRVGALPLNH